MRPPIIDRDGPMLEVSPWFMKPSVTTSLSDMTALELPATWVVYEITGPDSLVVDQYLPWFTKPPVLTVLDNMLGTLTVPSSMKPLLLTAVDQ